MIQWLLTFTLALVALFALREWRVSRLVGLGLLSIAAAGVLFVWMPRVADDIAHMFGVGRGADLVLYMYCAFSFLLVLNMSLKLRQQQEMLTQLARHIALAGVRTSESPDNPPR